MALKVVNLKVLGVDIVGGGIGDVGVVDDVCLEGGGFDVRRKGWKGATKRVKKFEVSTP